jgi:hypothetical protein
VTDERRFVAPRHSRQPSAPVAGGCGAESGLVATRDDGVESRGGAPRIGIVTRHDDFHAYVLRQVLASEGEQCVILLADSVACAGGLSWSDDGEAAPVLADDEGRPVDVAALDVVWWRRVNGEPRIPVTLGDESMRPLIVNDSSAAFLGLLLTSFRGSWVSPPEATRTAQNKLVQLRAARAAGLRVPRTLVSQDPARVRAFCAELARGPGAVVKPVVGAQNVPVMTGRIEDPELLDDAAVRLSPAIYQELVPGRRHLRVCCFGDSVHTAVLETDTLDWRYPLDADVAPYELDAVTAGRVQEVLRELGLRMGVVDMKLTPDGDPVWLEVNPQGQFLFLEGMCPQLPMSRRFSAFLRAEADRVAARR